MKNLIILYLLFFSLNPTAAQTFYQDSVITAKYSDIMGKLYIDKIHYYNYVNTNASPPYIRQVFEEFEKQFFPDSTIRSTRYIKYFSDDSITGKTQKIREIYTKYQTNGKIEYQNLLFDNGKFGVSVYYYDNGFIKDVASTTTAKYSKIKFYSNTKIHQVEIYDVEGRRLFYKMYKNGNPSKIRLEKKNYVYQEWYKNDDGNISSQRIFKKDIQIYTEYHKDRTYANRRCTFRRITNPFPMKWNEYYDEDGNLLERQEATNYGNDSVLITVYNGSMVKKKQTLISIKDRDKDGKLKTLWEKTYDEKGNVIKKKVY